MSRTDDLGEGLGMAMGSQNQSVVTNMDDVVFTGSLNVLLGQGNMDFGFVVTDTIDHARRNQDFFAGIPVTGFNDQIPDDPGLMIQ